jgi:hypothetical protein
LFNASLAPCGVKLAAKKNGVVGDDAVSSNTDGRNSPDCWNN